MPRLLVATVVLLEFVAVRPMVAMAADASASRPIGQPSAPPLLANLAANEGVARLRCKASVEGMLSECRVVAELPVGVGVGDAALKQVAASPHLDGVPAAGGVIEANFRIPLTPEQLAARTALPPAVYTQADWAKKPSAAQTAAVYPARAAEAGVGGSATLTCAVAGTGFVSACKVVNESPSGQGFGNAALKLAPFFQMRPKMEAGIPIAGTVTIPIRFTPPRASEPRLTCIAEFC